MAHHSLAKECIQDEQQPMRSTLGTATYGLIESLPLPASPRRDSSGSMHVGAAAASPANVCPPYSGAAWSGSQAGAAGMGSTQGHAATSRKHCSPAQAASQAPNQAPANIPLPAESMLPAPHGLPAERSVLRSWRRAAAAACGAHQAARAQPAACAPEAALWVLDAIAAADSAAAAAAASPDDGDGDERAGSGHGQPAAEAASALHMHAEGSGGGGGGAIPSNVPLRHHSRHARTRRAPHVPWPRPPSPLQGAVPEDPPEATTAAVLMDVLLATGAPTSTRPADDSCHAAAAHGAGIAGDASACRGHEEGGSPARKAQVQAQALPDVPPVRAVQARMQRLPDAPMRMRMREGAARHAFSSACGASGAAGGTSAANGSGGWQGGDKAHMRPGGSAGVSHGSGLRPLRAAAATAATAPAAPWALARPPAATIQPPLMQPADLSVGVQWPARASDGLPCAGGPAASGQRPLQAACGT